MPDVSRETLLKLQAFSVLLQKWTGTINLIAQTSDAELWQRHIVDTMQLHEFKPQSCASWVDLGSGGGIPGIVIAILESEFSNPTPIKLIESDQRKAAFLQTCKRELALDVTILPVPIEDASPQAADVVSARALAPLPRLLGYVTRHLAPDGLAILPKGRTVDLEIVEARKEWTFDLEQRPSQTDSSAAILLMRNIRRG